MLSLPRAQWFHFRASVRKGISFNPRRGTPFFHVSVSHHLSFSYNLLFFRFNQSVWHHSSFSYNLLFSISITLAGADPGISERGGGGGLYTTDVTLNTNGVEGE